MPVGSTRRPTRPQTRMPGASRAKAGSSRESGPLPPGARVLGVDPGLADLGWAVVEERAGRLVLVAWGVVHTYPAWPLARRLARIHDELLAVAARHQPQVLRIEAYVSYGAGHRLERKKASAIRPWREDPVREGLDRADAAAILLSGVGTGQAQAAAILGVRAGGVGRIDEPVKASDWQAAIGRFPLSRDADREAKKRLSAAVIRAQVAGIPPDAPDHVTDAAGIAASAWIGRRAQVELALETPRPRRRARG